MLSIAFIDCLGLSFDGSTLEKSGLGGSESAMISMARELAKLDFKVYVFNDCGSDNNSPGVYNGVIYEPLPNIIHHSFFDIVVASRSIAAFMENPQEFKQAFPDIQNFSHIISNSGYKVLWMHDTFCDGDNLIEDLILAGKIDKVFTLSDWHTTYITNCDHGKKRNFETLKPYIWQTRNGINSWIDWVDLRNKDKNLFVFNSSYTKGMEPLVRNIWPKIKEKIPEARLKVIGGFYRFRETDGPDAQENDTRRLMEEFEGTLGIEFTGVIPQKEIAEILALSSFMIYPAQFPETFGISTLEALYYNTPLITCTFGALEETAISLASYKMPYAIAPHVYSQHLNSEAQENFFVDITVQAYNQPYILQQKQNYCNIVKDIATWDTVALQWKQHFYRTLQKYLPLDEYHKVTEINDKVQRVFGRKFSNLDVPPITKKSLEKKITIITCCYNGQDYIERCIKSIKSQDYENYEVFIIDDNSSDRTLDIISNNITDKFTVISNQVNKGAVRNQVETLRKLSDNDIVIILDGDDALDNNPHIFDFYNNFYQNNSTEFTYGSCWSEADKIPLIAQPYPPEIKESKSYRSYKFNWGIPYTHLRTFKKYLINDVQDQVFQHNGEWVKAGGDVGLFYELIERADPNKIYAISEIFHIYNDLNPLNDYKINSEEQNETAQRLTNNMIDKKILIAIPTNKNICPETYKSIYDLKIPDGYSTDFQYFYGYQIDQIRNLIANWGQRYDYTLWVDSDIILPSNTLTKLLAHEKDIISGLYSRKIDSNLELYEDFEGGQVTINPDKIVSTGLRKVSGCGFGCVLTSNKVLNHIQYPHFYYKSALTMEETVSEDLYFCNKAKEHGYAIYADTSLLCGHIGEKVFSVDTKWIGYNEINSQIDRIKHLYAAYPDVGIPKEHMTALADIVPKYLSGPFTTYDIGSELLYWSRNFNELFPETTIYKFEGNPLMAELYEEVGESNYHIGVLAEEEKDIVLDVNNETGSFTIYEENKSYGQENVTSFSKRTERAYPLKKIVEERHFALPDLIKFDIQGAELQVIKGSQEIVKHAKLVIVELQHQDYILGAPMADEVIDYMTSIGFENLGEFCRNGVDGDFLFLNLSI